GDLDRSVILRVYAQLDSRSPLPERDLCHPGGEGRADTLPLERGRSADRTKVSGTFPPLAVPARGTADRTNFPARIDPAEPPRTRGVHAQIAIGNYAFTDGVDERPLAQSVELANLIRFWYFRHEVGIHQVPVF